MTFLSPVAPEGGDMVEGECAVGCLGQPLKTSPAARFCDHGEFLDKGLLVSNVTEQKNTLYDQLGRIIGHLVWWAKDNAMPEGNIGGGTRGQGKFCAPPRLGNRARTETQKRGVRERYLAKLKERQGCAADNYPEGAGPGFICLHSDVISRPWRINHTDEGRAVLPEQKRFGGDEANATQLLRLGQDFVSKAPRGGSQGRMVDGGHGADYLFGGSNNPSRGNK